MHDFRNLINSFFFLEPDFYDADEEICPESDLIMEWSAFSQGPGPALLYSCIF